MTRTVMLAGIGFGLQILGTPGTVTLGAAYTFTFKAFGGAGPYTFNETGSLPSGLTFTDNGNGTATISGTTSAPGNFQITVTLSDAARSTVTANFTVVVQALPLSISGHIAGGAAGTAASGSYTASGGLAPYTFSIISGTFPTTGGMSSAGVALGNWSATGNYSWQVQLQDSLGATLVVSDSCSNFVPLVVSNSFNSPIQVGVTDTSTLSISGGTTPYGVSVLSGTAPQDMTFGITGSTVAITHQPTLNGGSYSFTLRITSTDGQHVDKACTIVVGDSLISQVSTLMHGDGANLSTVFHDAISRVWSAINSLSTDQISTAQKYYGASSINLVSGTQAAGLATTYDATQDISAGDWTIEATVYQSATSATLQYILNKDGQNGVSYPQYALAIDTAGHLQVAIGDPTTLGGTPHQEFVGTAVTGTGAWKRVAATKSGTTVRGFVEGALDVSGTATVTMKNLTSQSLEIGNQVNNPLSYSWNGYIQEIRVTKGTARYTTAYTPSANPFPNPAPTVGALSGVTHGVSIIDPNGRSTIFGGYGSGSYSFAVTVGSLPAGVTGITHTSSGATDYMQLTGTATTAGTYNFTVAVTFPDGQIVYSAQSLVVS